MKKILLALPMMVAMVVARADVFDINLEDGVLNGAHEVPPSLTPATGGEVGVGMSYDNSTMTLSLNLAYGLFGFTPLQGNFTASHIHTAPIGANGGVTIPLAPVQIGTQAGFITSSHVLSFAQEASLFSNNLYVNVHSTLFPGGEIRAQLIPASVPEPSTLALAALGVAGLAAYRRSRKA